jgi:1,4-alpha-glucan branching enzyme
MTMNITRSFKSVLVVASSAILVGCFGGAARDGASRGGPEVVGGGVVFRYYDPKAKRVNLVGDFNNWSPRADAMVDENGDGEWTLFYDLPPGVYEYKYVVDGVRWIADPKNPDKVSDGFEGQNSVVRVPPE